MRSRSFCFKLQSEISEMEMLVKTIFLAEGERHVLDALHLLLEEQGDFEIVGEAQSAEILLTRVCQNAPDVILLDWNLPGAHHQRLVRALRECCPNASLIALSVRSEDERIAREYGLGHFISKQLPPDAFLASLNNTIEPKDNR
jgi:two-component system, NarL family, response regulator DevR